MNSNVKEPGEIVSVTGPELKPTQLHRADPNQFEPRSSTDALPIPDVKQKAANEAEAAVVVAAQPDTRAELVSLAEQHAKSTTGEEASLNEKEHNALKEGGRDLTEEDTAQTGSHGMLDEEDLVPKRAETAVVGEGTAVARNAHALTTAQNPISAPAVHMQAKMLRR